MTQYSILAIKLDYTYPIQTHGTAM